MDNKPEINPVEMDVLKELGNIGLGNATVALSQMLKDERIEMVVPEVELAPLSEVPDLVGGPDRAVAAIFARALGEVSFFLIFFMPVESAQNIIEALTEGQTKEFSELGRSVIREVGNIVGASFLNALSFLTNITFHLTPPILAIDMAEAILATIFAEANLAEDYILVVKTAFVTEDSNVEGYLFMIPNWEGLRSIVEILGLELK